MITRDEIFILYNIPKPTERDEEIVHHMLSLMPLYKVNNVLRIASYLAQVGHESGRLKYLEEIASGQRYEGRYDLGNTEEGDGKRFKGRGLIQVTGRANYTAFSKWSEIDVVSEPTRLTEPRLAVLSSMWFWDAHDLNAYADKDDLKGQTRVINGGYNGYEDRWHLFTTALDMMLKCYAV